MSEGYDAVVIGAGPNGLTAGVLLAGAGLSVLLVEAEETIGGGSRSAELTLPGFCHDVCAGFHPMGIASPVFSGLPLADHGLAWLTPDIELAHPLDDGSAGVLVRSTAESARIMGDPAYARLVEPLAATLDAWIGDVLAPPLRRPTHPVAYLRFGVPAALPTTTLARWALRRPQSRALLAGMAAHAMAPLTRPIVPSGTALSFAAIGHAMGWPVARGGSQAVADALASCFVALGGEVRTGAAVERLDDLPLSRIVVADVTPRQMVTMAGSRLSGAERRALSRFRYGPGAFKIDYALSEPVPWRAEPCRSAGMVHVGGTIEDVASAEAGLSAGRVPERPFMLVGQQSLVDPGRAPVGRHTLWTYCHVPAGCGADMVGAMEAQIERFAPGFGDVVMARAVRTPTDLETHNRNYVGGDIASGTATVAQILARPRWSTAPHRIQRSRLYLCSSSTSPGPGVHGMAGYWAVRTALADLGWARPQLDALVGRAAEALRLTAP